ncbi:MAG: DUF3343 domain-containing protein [Clostridium sp.]|uniref:DUF3343 domain-containing protein n=1 Tax=Clostridium sp. TaxID=1506 RepID=UPI003D6C92AA
MEYTAVFFTHSGAIKYDKYLKSISVCSELMPIPRKLSSNCGVGIKFNYIRNINEIISEDIEKLFSLENKEYKLIYTCE